MSKQSATLDSPVIHRRNSLPGKREGSSAIYRHLAPSLSPLEPHAAIVGRVAYERFSRMAQWPYCHSAGVLRWYRPFPLQPRRKFSRWMTPPFWRNCTRTSVIALAISSRSANAPVFLSRSNTVEPVTARHVVAGGQRSANSASSCRTSVSTWGFAMHGSWPKRSSHHRLILVLPAMLARYRDKRKMDSGVGRVVYRLAG